MGLFSVIPLYFIIFMVFIPLYFIKNRAVIPLYFIIFELFVYTNLKVYHFLIKKCTTPNRLRRYA